MLVCGTVLGDGTCGKELHCIKTGMDVWVDDHYAYRGDLFECPRCHSRVVMTNSTGEHRNKEIVIDAWTVKLDQRS